MYVELEINWNYPLASLENLALLNSTSPDFFPNINCLFRVPQ